MSDGEVIARGSGRRASRYRGGRIARSSESRASPRHVQITEGAYESPAGWIQPVGDGLLVPSCDPLVVRGRYGPGPAGVSFYRMLTVERPAAPAPSPEALAREATLVAWFRDHGSALIGFSGGVDSAYLAAVAMDALGAPGALAVIGRSASYPAEQWERARAVADQVGIPVIEITTDELNDPRYAANPNNRCYFCKTELWSLLVPIAAARGIAVVIDGTNADDLHGHRPGARAASEQGVLSPLATLGFSKDEIRALSATRGLPTWDQPSSPCLASRLPYGTEVTTLRLGKVEAAEREIRKLGVTGDLRVRYHGDVARVEMSATELATWRQGEKRMQLGAAIRTAGFTRGELDLRGFRSGSLNGRDEPLTVEALD